MKKDIAPFELQKNNPDYHLLKKAITLVKAKNYILINNKKEVLSSNISNIQEECENGSNKVFYEGFKRKNPEIIYPSFIKKVLTSQEDYIIENPITNSHSNEYQVFEFKPILSDQQNVLGVIQLMHTTTKNEDKIQSQSKNGNSSLLIDEIPFSYFTMNRYTRFLSSNLHWQLFSTIESDKNITKLTQLLSETDQEKLINTLQEKIELQEDFSLEVKLLLPNKQHKKTKLFIIPDFKGETTKTIHVFVFDFTAYHANEVEERRKYEKMLLNYENEVKKKSAIQMRLQKTNEELTAINEEFLVTNEQLKNEIEEKEELEKEISNNNAFLASIIENLPVGLQIFDQKGKLITLNKKQVLFNKSNNKLSVNNILAPDFDSELISKKHIEMAYRGATFSSQEIHLEEDSSAENKYFLRSIFPIRSKENNKVLALAIMLEDITKGKQSEVLAIKSQEIMKTVLNNMEAIVYVTNLDTYEIIFYNQYTEKIFGNIAHKKCHEVFYNRKTPCLDCYNEDLMKKNRSLTWEYESPINGKYYHCVDTIIPWTDGNKVKLQIATDISNRKISEEKIKQQYKTILQNNEALKRSKEQIEIANMQLKMSEKNMRVLISNLPNMDFYFIDQNLQILVAGGSEMKRHNFSPQDFEGKKIGELGFLGKDTVNYLLRMCKSTINGISVMEEISFNHIQYQHRGIPLRDLDGKVYGGIFYSHNITEIRKAQEKISFWHDVFKNAKWGVVVGSADGNELTLMNKAFADMHGYTVEELTGMKFKDVFAKEEHEKLNMAMQTAQEEGHFVFESVHLKKNGKKFPVNIDVSSVKDENNTVRYRVVNVQDISDRIAAEQKIKQQFIKIKTTNSQLKKAFAAEKKLSLLYEESENRLNAILEASPDLMLLLDSHYTIINAFSSDKYKFPFFNSNLKNTDISKVFPKVIYQNLLKVIQKSAEDNSVKLYNFTMEKDMKTYYYESRIVQTQNSKILIIIRNNTETKMAELASKQKQAQIEQSGKLVSLGEMATGIAHELNQPLAIIRGKAEYLSLRINKENISKNDFNDHLKVILQHVDRSANIIQHMKNFARREKKVFSSESVEKIIENSLLFFREQFKNRNILIETFFEVDIPMVNIHPISLEQVMVNLLSNARYAVDEKEKNTPDFRKHIIISLEKNKGKKHITIMVSDNGIGMSETELNKCMEPFFTTKDAGKGTGLGLSIAFNLLKEFNANIKISSKKNQGTKVFIEIPFK